MARKCACAKCAGVGRPRPVYGYDLDAVPTHPCLMCGQPIGAEPYREYLVWARWGDMFLIHERCWDGRERKGDYSKTVQRFEDDGGSDEI